MTTVTKTIWIDAPPSKVFEFFTISEKLQQWSSVGAKVEPVVGGIYQLDMGEAGIIGGHITAIEPPHLLSYKIIPPPELKAGTSTITVKLSAEAGGTRVDLEQSGLVDPFPAIASRGLDHHLARLSVVSTGGKPGLDSLCSRSMDSLIE